MEERNRELQLIVERVQNRLDIQNDPITPEPESGETENLLSENVKFVLVERIHFVKQYQQIFKLRKFLFLSL